jgi:DNA-binding CsgD family transcriptional regulator
MNTERQEIEESHKKALAINQGLKNELRSICQPLFSSTPITSFHYARFKTDGKYLFLSTEQKAVEIYYEHNSKNTNREFIEGFKYLPSGSLQKFLWLTADKSLGIDQLLNINIAHGLNVSIKYPEYVETFIFATSRNTSQIIDLYLNHFLLLEAFIDYFKSQFEHLMNVKDFSNWAFSPFYKEQIKISYTQEKSIIRPRTIIKQFRDQGKMQERHLLSDLSQRECDCMSFFLRGQTVKETAQILNLSPRTVESHLKHIKNKLGIKEKREIFQLAYKDHKVRTF